MDDDPVGAPHESYVARAIRAVSEGELAYCKFLSANDTGDTGAHQAGIYVAKNALTILFDTPGLRGANKDRHVKITWQDDFATDSRFIYYGQKTRNEYRITRFGKGFPFLTTEHTGDLFVFVKQDTSDYRGYVLSTEDDIDAFLEHFGMSPADTGSVIESGVMSVETQLDHAMREFINTLNVDFPETREMALAAQSIEEQVFNHTGDALLKPDKKLLAWIEIEYRLFRKLEQVRYGERIAKGFSTVEQFATLANSILNKRKSRAGKSLEHHLARIFDANDLRYSAQPRTEGNKHPDFLFPSEAAYHTPGYPLDRMIFLAAKTTCKDRWRQVINEADLFKGSDRAKHLFTLQQGISAQQMDEMEDEGVVLVVPQPYIITYPASKRDRIWTLKKFVEHAKERAI
jgi:type II restriction enzyme